MGNLDMEGIRYLITCYATQYQPRMPYQEDNLSIGIKKQDVPVEFSSKSVAALEPQP
jgi:hypothetical protein